MLLSILLTTTTSLAQTTQPATRPAAAQPATTQHAPDRTKPIGMCVEFDKTIADLGIDGGMSFYHLTTNAHRRYARSELEFYVAVNKLVRVVEQKHGKDQAKIVRTICGDSDDYSDATVMEDGDSAAMQRPGQTPFPLIKIDGKWRFSIPDWFDIVGEDEIAALRLHYEAVADRADAVREKIESGELKTPQQIHEALDPDEAEAP